MREIKFRAWNKKLKKFAPESCSIQIQGDDAHVSFDYFDGNFNTAVWALSDVELMQYTGLKDEKGVKLYEGDIYLKWGERYKCDFERVMYEKQECLIFGGDFMIVGNIYENPELLEQPK